MAREITDFGNFTPVSGTYPYGQIKDDTGSNDGTPVNVLTNGDLQQFFQKMMAGSGITPNGNPDNADNGFQLWEANLTAISANVAQVVILMIGSSYSTSVGYVLSGLSSEFQDGFMLFDGKIYFVEGYSTGTGAPYGINRGSALGATQDTFLRAVVESDGTPDMCLYDDLVRFNSQTEIDPADFNSPWQGTPDVPLTYSIDTNGYVHWDGKIRLNGAVNPSIFSAGGLPAETRPLVTSCFHLCMCTVSGGSISSTGTDFSALLQIYADGRLRLQAYPTLFASSGDYIDLTGLSYKVR
jgi:hypothetical protein